MHGGGIAGLRQGETAAVLQNGEVVLPAGATAGEIRVVVNNYAGASVQPTAQRLPGGGVQLTLDVVAADTARRIARGDFDRPLDTRYGTRPAPRRR
jgi:hypothetical protein